MTNVYEPRLDLIDIASLHPTQMTVGYREVEKKRRAWRDLSKDMRPEFLGRHMVPVVIGPKDVLYLVDHHHLARALHEEVVSHVLVSVLANLGHLEKDEFRSFMDHRNWVYPFDTEGARQPFEAIPRSIAELEDDPYRSLAGALRDAGGFAKDVTPFSEFMWADFLRNRIDRKRIRHDFDGAFSEATSLAHSVSARHLPGWCGPERP